MKKITYIEFAKHIIEVMEGIESGEFSLTKLENEEQANILTSEMVKVIKEKAEDLKAANERKANSSREKRPTGPSEKTLEKLETMLQYLEKGKENAKCYLDITDEKGEQVYKAPEIANTLKYSEVKIGKTQVIREVKDLNGLKQQRRYTAYYIAE